ncbi:cytochrome P450 [Aaosphaeria arxii CBS 175.79]|uniref:Cytochrome P450 n=1 Tax=Aaosphaeria arxii CBS 175.79 TaxID=1450172 RepID=A0A6A5XQ24_9PLEO|nr:cytochrome P450 [Aaosphaeria arxii CBS 175.79]KAF2014861.1 cytochrome P450 [Aaosphaeria arxii CBS 175.79]
MYLFIFVVNTAIALAVLCIWRRDFLSRICDIYLVYRYPIHDFETGQPLPTHPYVFPNGQGNYEKLVRGRENSPKWAKEYGPLYRIWSGFTGEIIVTRPADIEAVFRDSHAHIKAIGNNFGYLGHRLIGDCLGLVSGSVWRSIRRATEPPLLRTSTASHVDTVKEEARNHLAGVIDPTSKSGQLHIKTDLRFYPFNALARILYGELSPELQTRLLAFIPARDKINIAIVLGGMTRFWFSKFLPLSDIQILEKFKSEWSQWNDDAHREAVEKAASGQAKQPGPIIQMYEAVADGSMTREALLQTLDEMLFGNLDVAVVALAWDLVFLANDQGAQNRVLEEIRNECTPEKEDAFLLSQNNFLQNIILEAGRLRPASPFSISQSCPTPRRVGNFMFPAGTNFVVDSYALNVRDPLWGPDNTTFRPERWQEGGVKRAKDIRYCYWRFGFGPRLCVGKYVADLMLKTMIVELVKDWELKLVKENGEPWAFDPETCFSLDDPDMRLSYTRRKQ